jgi:hypothetical protein
MAGVAPPGRHGLGSLTLRNSLGCTCWPLSRSVAISAALRSAWGLVVRFPSPGYGPDPRTGPASPCPCRDRRWPRASCTPLLRFRRQVDRVVQVAPGRRRHRWAPFQRSGWSAAPAAAELLPRVCSGQRVAAPPLGGDGREHGTSEAGCRGHVPRALALPKPFGNQASPRHPSGCGSSRPNPSSRPPAACSTACDASATATSTALLSAVQRITHTGRHVAKQPPRCASSCAEISALGPLTERHSA